MSFSLCLSLSKKQYSIFMLRAAARIQSNLLCKFINSGSMYLGIYTREEKMCPQDAVFLRDSLESVVSSERLFGKQSFSTASERTNRSALSLSKKQYSIFMLRAAARIQSNLLCNFINSGSMVQTTLSCRYAAIHLVYLGIYTREEKMCPQDAVFLQHSIESVVSIERLLEKR